MNKDDWVSICGDMVHRLDRDRLMCATVAPVDKRGALLALLAFNLEIATIPELVSEPLLGEIRLQWWRDALDSIYAGTKVEHPVALGLAEGVARHHFSKTLFDEYLDARSFDLNGEAPASLDALESYAEATAGALNELMAEALGVAALAPALQRRVRDASRQAGVAWALSGLLNAVSFHSRQGRSYLPADLGHGEKIPAVVETARRYIRQARTARKEIPNSMLPIMLPVALAEYRLRQLDRCGYDTQDVQALRPGVGRLFGFYWKVLLKRY